MSSCPLCDDTGWQPVESNGRRRVVRCECWRQELTGRLLAGARIPKRYQHCGFETFVTYGNESLERAVAHARRLAERFPVVDKGLFLLGPPGVGKTHLAVAILQSVVRERSARGIFYDTRELLRVIRSTYDPIAQSTELDVLRPVMQADLLVLDDLGAEKASEWVDETLNLIVNERYSAQRVTIFTSNYRDEPDPGNPDTLLCRIGFRMRSRLHEMCEFLDLDGADYRELPPNGGPDDLRTLWKLRQRGSTGRLPARSAGQVRAELKTRQVLPAPATAPGAADVRWTGGKITAGGLPPSRRSTRSG